MNREQELQAIQNFLEKETFKCIKYFNVRISRLTCEYLSARAYKKYQEAINLLAMTDAKDIGASQSKHKLQSFLAKAEATCITCPKYKEPTKEMLKKIEKPFGRVLRYYGHLPKTSSQQTVIS